MFRRTIARGRLTVPIACSVIATLLPFSAATAEDAIPAGDGALYQDAAQDASTGEWVEPATVDPPLADAAAPDQASAPAPTEEWVEPVATDAATDTTSKEALVDSTGSVDPATGEWTDPGAADSAGSSRGRRANSGSSQARPFQPPYNDARLRVGCPPPRWRRVHARHACHVSKGGPCSD